MATGTVFQHIRPGAGFFKAGEFVQEKLGGLQRRTTASRTPPPPPPPPQLALHGQESMRKVPKSASQELSPGGMDSSLFARLTEHLTRRFALGARTRCPPLVGWKPDVRAPTIATWILQSSSIYSVRGHCLA